MHKRTHRALIVSSAVMMFSGYLALVTTEVYTASTLLIPLVIFAMAPAFVWLDGRMTSYRAVTSFVTLCVAFFLFGMWLVRAAELIHVMIWLFVYIQWYLMCHRKTVAYYYYLFLMSFFVLIAACAQEPEPSFAFGLGLFILSSVWALFTLHVYAESKLNDDHSRPDIIDSHDRGTIVPQRVTAVFDRNLYASIAALSFSSVLLTALMFIATPRMEAGIFGASNTIKSTTDVTSEIDLNVEGAITPDPALIMRVQFPDEPDGVYGGDLFWRSTSLELYRNARWERSALRDNRYRDKTTFYGFNDEPENNAVRRHGPEDARRIRQEIYLDDGTIEGLPALAYIQAMSAQAGELRWDPRHDTTVFISNLKQSSLNYEAWSDVPEVDADTLRAAPANYPAVMGQWYRILTYHDLDPRTVTLARNITRSADSPYDKVVAIQNHFLTTGYEYSLNVNTGGAFKPVDNFIHNIKSGHCELYASAMALMVRSLGIPARVVSGYHGGEWNESDEAYLVRKNMAHLWVEVYFIDHGWVTFDPSPPAAISELDAWDSVSRAFGRYALNAKMLWYRDVVGFQGGIQWARLRDALRDSVKLDFSFLNRDAENALSVSGFVVPLAIVWLAVVGLAGWAAFSLVAYVRRRSARRQAGAMTTDQLRAQRVYTRLKRKLAKLGADCDGKTSRELLAHIVDNKTIDSGPVHNVVDVYNRVRFGGYPMSRDEYQRLSGVVRRIHRAGS